MKSQKLKKVGRLSALLASVVAVFALLGPGASSPVFAQELDAGAILADAMPAVDASPAPAVAPVEIPPVDKAPVPQPEVAAAPTQTSLDKLSSEILNILLPAFGLLIGGLVTAILRWVLKRFKLDVSDKQISQWSTVAEMAAARAGEWARNRAKTLTEGKAVPGPEILEVAANWGIDYGIAHGLPQIGREKLEGLIEARLNIKRSETTLLPVEG